MGSCVSSRLNKKENYYHSSNVQNRYDSKVPQKRENNDELQPYWSNYKLGNSDIDINKEPNIQNIIKTFGI
jgi:hypothetical protein